MDRQIIYAGSIPLDTDQLQQSRNNLTALGFALQAMLGTGINVDGLVCTPTTPASMQVQVGAGAIYALQNLDNTAYGSLAADTSSNHQIVKQGLLLAPVMLSCPAPSGTGQSINYLIEAAYQDSDTGATVLPYYNAANPSAPFSGPNNTGISQNTARQGLCVVQVKAGVAATTGSQTTPAADTGFTGLYVVTVSQSTTSITGANISVLPTAPFIPLKLPQQRIRLQSNATYFVSPSGSDTANSGVSASFPWATLQHAWNYIQQNLDLGGFAVTIQLANGTYTSGLSATGVVVGSAGPGSVVFLGNTSSPSAVTISVTNSSCFTANFQAQFLVQGMTLQATGTGTGQGNAIQAGAYSEISFSSMVFGACAQAHISAGEGGVIKAGSPYTISGSAVGHAIGAVNAIINLSSAGTITLTGVPAFTNGFIELTVSASCEAGGLTFVGSASGPRFLVSTNSVLATGGTSQTSYLPGNANGTLASGGAYQ